VHLLTVRKLRRRRLAVVVGVLIGLAIGVRTGYNIDAGMPPKVESRQYPAGIATAEVLVDSPTSLAVDVGGVSTEIAGQATDIVGVWTRAHLLAGLLASSPLKDRIARDAGIAPKQLVVIAPTGDRPSGEDGQAVSGLNVDLRKTAVIDIVVHNTMPIMSMTAQARDEALARRLADAAVGELRGHLASVANDATVPEARRLGVAPLGETSSATIVKGPRRMLALVAFLFFAGVWCTAIAVGPRLARTWRETARLEAAAPPVPRAGG
jgi:hypothetical protein